MRCVFFCHVTSPLQFFSTVGKRCESVLYFIYFDDKSLLARGVFLAVKFNFWIQDRIFLFVFGGRDANYEDDELAYRNAVPTCD